MSNQTRASASPGVSAFGRRLLRILSKSDAPLSVSEITDRLPESQRTTETLVKTYLQHGLRNQVEEVESGRWACREANSKEAETTSTTSNDERAHSEHSNPTLATRSTEVEEDFLHHLAHLDKSAGLETLKSRLQERGYDVPFQELVASFSSFQELIGRGLLPNWTEEEENQGHSRLFRISEEAYQLASDLRTASKLVVLLGASASTLTTEELRRILLRVGQDVPESEIERVLQTLLKDVVEAEAREGWSLLQDRDFELAVSTEQKQPESRHRENPTPQEFISQVEGWLDGSTQAVIPSSWITERWALVDKGHLTEEEARALSGFLGGYGFGIEPDIRFGGNPSECKHVVVFRDEGTEKKESARFDAARLLLELGAAVASADQEISDEEERRIEQHLEEALYLNASERARLRAHLERRLSHPPNIDEIRRRARELPKKDRRRLAKFLITVAGADGTVQQEEVALLQKIYDVLDLDVESLERDLQEMAAPIERENGPVTVIRGGEESEEYSVPEEGSTSENGADHGKREARSSSASELQLDVEKVGQVQAETREVAQALREVFEDPEQEKESRTIERPGLGSSHISLIAELEGRSSWPREEFERMAEERGLMPGFAFEQINEVTFNEVNEPLLEGSDPIELNAYALEALKT